MCAPVPGRFLFLHSFTLPPTCLTKTKTYLDPSPRTAISLSLSARIHKRVTQPRYRLAAPVRESDPSSWLSLTTTPYEQLWCQFSFRSFQPCYPPHLTPPRTPSHVPLLPCPTLPKCPKSLILRTFSLRSSRWSH